jgi:condensin complex subunit 2
VDPLFKKVAADFDEGGAKGLLLNHLAIDSNGRIVFDSSDDAEDASGEVESTRRKIGATTGDDREEDEAATDEQQQDVPSPAQTKDIDIASLGAKFFPNLDRLDEQHVCASLKNFDLGDPTGSLDIPFLKAPDDWRQETNSPIKGNLGDQTGIFLDGDNVAGFEDDDGVLGGFDMGADAGFGEGGEAWAKHAAIEPQLHMRDVGFDEGVGEDQGEGMGVGNFDPESNEYAVSLHHKKTDGGHEDILSYFDNALKKNWAGPEHWRIRRIKDINKASAPAPSKRKEKEPFEIDFASPLDPAIAEMIYTPATSNSSISLPKTQWKSKTRNLLPDDKHFNSRQLLRLFLKPKARMGSRRQIFGTRRQGMTDEVPENEMDEAFWARKENIAHEASPDEEAQQGDYDANFFQDDGLGFPDGPPDDDEEFADAREAFSPGVEGEAGGESQGIAAGSQEGAFGTQLVTQSRRLRPEYVQYARVAKKVDVRRLKEEMWRGTGFEDVCFLCILHHIKH